MAPCLACFHATGCGYFLAENEISCLRTDKINTKVLIMSIEMTAASGPGLIEANPGSRERENVPQSRSEISRGEIVKAAERLFAERGIDSVSMVEIGQEAGQKNRSAVQYHFGDKAGVLRAIREKHQLVIEAHRIEMLDQLEASSEATLRDFVEVFVLPLAERLIEADGGVAYVRISASLIGHIEYSTLSSEAITQKTAARLFGHFLRKGQPLPGSLIPARMLLITSMVFHGLANWSRLPEQNGGVSRERLDEFSRDLVTCVVSVLKTPSV